MAYPTTIIAIFCEDIRVEVGGIVSLIGILPDHIQVETAGELQKRADGETNEARALPKLGIYVRIAFDPDTDLEPPQVLLSIDGDEPVRLGEIPAETVQKARKEAKSRGNLLAGVIFRAKTTGFRIPKLGVARVDVKIGKTTHLAGALNFTPPLTSTEP
jgi:hypothetical protein